MLSRNRYLKVLREALANYFMVRNCIVHNNGLIDEARNPERIKQYADEKGIVLDNPGQTELLINEEFNNEVCATMHQFLTSYIAPIIAPHLPMKEQI